ncbi:iron complex outermembrane recepter protein [Altererythrobacter xiamenensis]|uniref:Iron complex outermembrane recepter protein n=1 Tax=Altererythrobacter xiamenensis TaxID=1316679 RepID=A0A1Y6F900_9SPHN|nr:TonB-dependent receptor [Altererythrobacter xiamenensis]SMQ69840.1 iron complex outermembrane recepter protein [Altererythrobacter xiamenensis]
MRRTGFSANARLLCGAATGMALLVSGAPAFAQDSDADEGEENTIVVTGIRSAIENSLDAKRESSSIVEVISAEDIGKLPDLSIADSLARLPGVTAQRVRGRSQQISIRGLGPDFSLALLNGREVVSAGNNRGIEFDQFPSELIAQGIVYKTPDARLSATGIAGAVDLRTIRPLDYNETKINMSARYVINDAGKLNPDFSDQGYRFFGSYIGQNDAGTVGWSLGVTHQSNPTQFISRELKTNQFQVSRDANGLLYPSDNPRQGVVSRDFERTSIAGALQFEPSDRFQLTLDAFYTDTQDSGIFRGTETPIASWSGASFDSATGSGPFADTATYTAVVPILRTDTEGNEAEIFAAGANLSYEVTNRLSLEVDYGYSTLDRNDIDYESYAGTGFARSGAQDTLTFTMPDDGRYSIASQLDYTDPGTVLLTDPGGWGQVGFIKEPIIEDELHQLRAEVDYALDAGILSSVTLGWIYKDREKNFDSNEGFIRQSPGFTNGSLAIPSDAIIGSTNTKSLGMDIIAYDPSNFFEDGTYVYEKATFDTQWSVAEEIHTFYGMINLNGDLGSIPLRGNIGVQYVDTKQSSTGTIGGGLTNQVSDSYDHWLPSVNLSFEVANDTFVKMAFAKTLTRPRLDQLAANQNITVNPLSCTDTDGDQIPDTVIAFNPPQLTCFNLGGGNPQLRPYRSTSYDISFEKYFSRTSALAVAVFHKDLSDWVIQFSDTIDIEQQIINAGFGNILQTAPELATASFNGPVNFSSGKITGVEATLRLDFADFTDAFDGFGGSFSYTYADAEVEDANGDPLDIPGYSENVWSADLFYEKAGFQGKLSARHRSGFLSEVQNFDGSLSGAQALSETILDAQIGYTFEDRDGWLDGFGIQFEVFNLTNEPFVTENALLDTGGNQIGTFPSRHEVYGRTYNVTIKKEF